MMTVFPDWHLEPDSGVTEPVPQALVKLREQMMWQFSWKYSCYHSLSYLYLQRQGVCFPSLWIWLMPHFVLTNWLWLKGHCASRRPQSGSFCFCSLRSQLPCCKETQATLPNNERTWGKRLRRIKVILDVPVQAKLSAEYSHMSTSDKPKETEKLPSCAQSIPRIRRNNCCFMVKILLVQATNFWGGL